MKEYEVNLSYSQIIEAETEQEAIDSFCSDVSNVRLNNLSYDVDCREVD